MTKDELIDLIDSDPDLIKLDRICETCKSQDAEYIDKDFGFYCLDCLCQAISSL